MVKPNVNSQNANLNEIVVEPESIYDSENFNENSQQENSSGKTMFVLRKYMLSIINNFDIIAILKELREIKDEVENNSKTIQEVEKGL